MQELADFFSVEWHCDLPVVAVALHDGHAVREDVAGRLVIRDADRLREEDPYTGEWTGIGGVGVKVSRSRFEVDLNRPRHRAIYRRPEDAWGLEVWQEQPPERVLEASLALYDRFYTEMESLFEELERRYGCFLVLDLHAYNHRRGGPEAPPDAPCKNPQINVGTSNMDREKWAPVVDRFVDELRRAELQGAQLDVRKNVKFPGGHFSRWIHCRFRNACSLAIEFKKFFMDEWTGKPDRQKIDAISVILNRTVPEMLRGLDEVCGGCSGRETARGWYRPALISRI